MAEAPCDSEGYCGECGLGSLDEMLSGDHGALEAIHFQINFWAQQKEQWTCKQHSY